jgi:hypothetical protein
MNSKEVSISDSDLNQRVAALKARIANSPVHSSLVAKVVHTSSSICKPDEFNIWHANADGVKGNGGDRPWGAFGVSTAEK